MRLHLRFTLLTVALSALLCALALGLIWFHLVALEQTLHRENQGWLQRAYLTQFSHHSQQDLKLLITSRGLRDLKRIDAQALRPWAKSMPQITWYRLTSPQGEEAAWYEYEFHDASISSTSDQEAVLEFPIELGTKKIGLLRAGLKLPEFLGQSPEPKASNLFTQMLTIVLPPLGVLLAAGGLLAWGLNRWLTRPLRAVPRYIQQMLAGNFNIRLPRRTDEIGRIFRALRQVEQVIQAQRKSDAPSPAEKHAMLFAPEQARSVRTSLNDVMGITELLLASELPPHQREFLTSIQQATDRLWLELSKRMPTATAHPTPRGPSQVFALRGLLDEIIEQHLPDAERKKVPLISSIAPLVPANVAGDSAFLRQILSNLLQILLDNTFCGDLAVRAQLPEKPHLGADFMVLFDLEVHGQWTQPENRQKMATVLNEQTPMVEETSQLCIALSATLRMVKNLGGEMLLRPGEAPMILRVAIPLRPALPEMASPAVPKPTPSESSPVAAKDLRILVAEDNPVNLTITLNMLKLLGYEPEFAHNGQEVLDALGQHELDLILMDCAMPSMDGYDATLEIRRQEQHGEREGRLPIIALTANATQSDRDYCLTVGMDDYLSKPFKLFQLEETLARNLRAVGKL